MLRIPLSVRNTVTFGLHLSCKPNFHKSEKSYQQARTQCLYGLKGVINNLDKSVTAVTDLSLGVTDLSLGVTDLSLTPLANLVVMRVADA